MTRHPVLATTLAALCLLLVVAGVAVFLYVHPAQAQAAQAEDRAAVVQAAERFVETRDTFTAKDVDGYIARVGPLLTTKFRAQFVKLTQGLAEGIKQQSMQSKGKVLVDEAGIPLVGIARIDPDSATVLTVSDAYRVVSGQKVLRHFRGEIQLVKVQGKWLVDDFKNL